MWCAGWPIDFHQNSAVRFAGPKIFIKHSAAYMPSSPPQVVPTAYSLKVLAQRSRQVQEAGGWVEYFDPDTSAFWYLEKVRSARFFFMHQ